MEDDEAGLVRVTIDQIRRNRRKLEDEDPEAPPAVRPREAAVAGAGASSSSAGPAVIEENMEISELCMNLSAMGEGVVQVGELFWPGRVTSSASAFDLIPVMSLDLPTVFYFNMQLG